MFLWGSRRLPHTFTDRWTDATVTREEPAPEKYHSLCSSPSPSRKCTGPSDPYHRALCPPPLGPLPPQLIPLSRPLRLWTPTFRPLTPTPRPLPPTPKTVTTDTPRPLSTTPKTVTPVDLIMPPGETKKKRRHKLFAAFHNV